MNRKIKFRVWVDSIKKFMYPIGILNLEDTLQQYTGIKDKNDKEIYEGDLIKYNVEGYDKIGPGTVEFFAGMFICSWKDQTDNELGYMMNNDMEVIGNIFEKTDL